MQRARASAAGDNGGRPSRAAVITTSGEGERARVVGTTLLGDLCAGGDRMDAGKKDKKRVACVKKCDADGLVTVYEPRIAQGCYPIRSCNRSTLSNKQNLIIPRRARACAI